MPKTVLPINQKIPNEHSKIPYPVARQYFGTKSVTTAFKIDSCAPMPIPHIAIPIIKSGKELKAKMKIAKLADKIDAITNEKIPNLS